MIEHRYNCTSYFNPRSREGSDFQLILSRSKISDFNPRSREGSDSDDNTFPSMSINFNPRSREGSDEPWLEWQFFHQAFQSTLPRRERLGCR